MIRLNKAVAVLIVTSALLVSGCSSMSNKDIGSVVGVVVGTTVGIGIGVLTGGKSGGEAAAVVGGIVGLGVGGMLGAFIGEQLDEAERLKAENAALKAANDETAIPVAWKSDTRPDVHGHATVLSTYANLWTMRTAVFQCNRPSQRTLPTQTLR